MEQNFADKVKPDKGIYKGAIPGMLRTLDPHSNFFDPRITRRCGKTSAATITASACRCRPRNGKTIVMAPFAGSPAYRAGLRPGDVILEVNDKKTDSLTTTEVADLLKGPRGTKVQVKVGREGIDQPIVFNIIRDEIPRFSVPEPST